MLVSPSVNDEKWLAYFLPYILEKNEEGFLYLLCMRVVSLCMLTHPYFTSNYFFSLKCFGFLFLKQILSLP